METSALNTNNICNRSENKEKKCLFLNMMFTLSFSQSQVCQTKSTDSLPFSTSLAGFVVSLEWLMYGHLVSDFYIEVGGLEANLEFVCWGKGVLLGHFEYFQPNC